MSRSDRTPRPPPMATGIYLMGLGATYSAVSHGIAAEMAHTGAVGAGLSLAASLLFDLRKGIRNLVRADVMALVSLYCLTLVEFLFPQPEFNALVTPEEAGPAITACLVAAAGLAVGRHVAPPASRGLARILRREFPPRLLLTMFWIAIVGGFFYQWMAVSFDPVQWVQEMMGPRFSQSWTRDKFGDWKALFGELGMIVNLAPPVAGIILARRAEYSRQAVTQVILGLALVLFYGFTSGTRNVLVTFCTTFGVAFAFTIDSRKKLRELLAVSALTAAVTAAGTFLMLEFRNIGFSNYLNGYRAGTIENTRSTLFVDYNLYVIAKLIEVFPERQPYLGFEIPYLSLIRPIPRALWSGKPQGLSVGIEQTLGAEGLTLASSFVGESYMSGGLVGVLMVALVFGSIMGWWNRFGDPNNSPFGHLVFASGFFAAVISMRSMFVFTTAILPTIGALVLGAWLLGNRPARPAPAAPPNP